MQSLCKKCGSEVDRDATFCTNCGAAIERLAERLETSSAETDHALPNQPTKTSPRTKDRGSALPGGSILVLSILAFEWLHAHSPYNVGRALYSQDAWVLKEEPYWMLLSLAAICGANGLISALRT